MMITCIDVCYVNDDAWAACVQIAWWEQAEPEKEIVIRTRAGGDYAPGAFYQRELPPLLAVLEMVQKPLAAIVIDGYVWLDAGGAPGLGARLHQVINGAVPVIGVAKTRYGRADFAVPVRRGTSHRPLYITAAGMPLESAAGCIARMHGESRMPTVLKRADTLSKTSWPRPSSE